MKVKTMIINALKLNKEFTNIKAILITGKNSAPREIRKLQESGIIDSRWNNEDKKDFKYYFLAKNET